MSNKVPNVKLISDMFIAFVRNNKVAPGEIEDVVRAIVRGLSANGRTVLKRSSVLSPSRYQRSSLSASAL